MGRFSDRIERIHRHLVNCIEFTDKLDKNKGIPVGDFKRFIEVIADDLERAQLDMPLRCEEHELRQEHGSHGQSRIVQGDVAFNFREMEPRGE